MRRRALGKFFSVVLAAGLVPWAGAQAFRVQCPTTTSLHPAPGGSSLTGAPYNGPETFTDPGTGLEYTSNGGQVKCQQVSGGDGYATMADGTQIYMFAFGPLSGLANIAAGQPGTVTPREFNEFYPGNMQIGDPATTDGGRTALDLERFSYNGAVGLTYNAFLSSNENPGSATDGHIDPRPVMDVGAMNGNQPGPLVAIDEDDELFLTLTNVGMLMRPDLFEQHTIHFLGYPNASAFYDGVPEASVAMNIGGSMSYYYLAPEAGTYFWHCHITPAEHLQMGMVGQLYVRPRQNRVPVGDNLYASLLKQQTDPRTKSNCVSDILCGTPVPMSDNGIAQEKSPLTNSPYMYAYNDGDGSTRYDVEYPLQIHGFDPNFHLVGMTFNPEDFAGMKDKYFLLNGRSYPDTIQPGPMETPASDGTNHFSQPMAAIINIPKGGRALLRISDLDVTEYQTLGSLGIPMQVIAQNARLLRDQAGSNLYYDANSITLAGGESIDVILDASDTSSYPVGSKFFLYTTNLDHLSNDAENFGGLMTEVNICGAVDPVSKACTL